MSKRDITLYIVDIFIAIYKINDYTKEIKNSSEFLQNELIWDATIRELEIIGELTKHLLNDNILPKEYRRVVDFRNQINHAYFGIDENIVWDVIKNKLPAFESDLILVIKDLKLDIDYAIEKIKEDKSFTLKVEKALEVLKSKM